MVVFLFEGSARILVEGLYDLVLFEGLYAHVFG